MDYGVFVDTSKPHLQGPMGYRRALPLAFLVLVVCGAHGGRLPPWTGAGTWDGAGGLHGARLHGLKRGACQFALS